MANLLIQPAPVPSVGRSMRNALTMKGAQTQNLLAEQQLQDYPEEMEWKRKTRQRQELEWTQSDEGRKFQKKIKVIGLALDAPNTKAAESILKYGGVTDFKIEGFEKGKQKISFPGIEIDADKMVMRQLVQTFEDNPAWYKNPEMVRQVLDRAIDLGANVKMEETEKPKAPTLKPMENKDGKWTYHEWKDGKWVDTKRGAKAPEKEKDNIKDLAKWYSQAIGRANSAKLKVGQFIADPNSEAVAKQEYKRAKIILDQYIKAGGNPADLGIVAQKGISLRNQAIEILKTNNKVVNEGTITKVMDRIEKNK